MFRSAFTRATTHTNRANRLPRLVQRDTPGSAVGIERSERAASSDVLPSPWLIGCTCHAAAAALFYVKRERERIHSPSFMSNAREVARCAAPRGRAARRAPVVGRLVFTSSMPPPARSSRQQSRPQGARHQPGRRCPGSRSHHRACGRVSAWPSFAGRAVWSPISWQPRHA